MAAKKKPRRASADPKPGNQGYKSLDASTTGDTLFRDDSSQNRDDHVRLGFPVVGNWGVGRGPRGVQEVFQSDARR